MAYKLKIRLGPAPAEVLMLRQLAAATKAIVAWIVGAGDNRCFNALLPERT
jgi:hypothetical protein